MFFKFLAAIGCPLIELYRKSIAIVVNESMPRDSQSLLRSQKENQNFIKNFKNPELNTKKTHE